MELRLEEAVEETPPGDEQRTSDKGPNRRSTAVLIVILLVGLIIRLLYFFDISSTAYPRVMLALTNHDMIANWQWAQAILSGDLLGRNTYHPYFDWMKDFAPLETWYHWWNGKEIFQQAPLYPYWIAGLLEVSRNSLEFVLLSQLITGALQPLIMFGLGRRLFDARAGLIAAALTALYGPFVFHQGTLLRDWLPPILEPLSLLLLLRAREKERGRDWCLAGVVLGLALLTKETVLLFLPLVGIWLLWQPRFAWRDVLSSGALLAVGLLLSLSPLLIRNAAVGAPLYALSNRFAETFIQGNAANSYPVGLNWGNSMKRILEKSDGRIGKVILETANTYNGDWRRFAWLKFLKLRGMLDPLEVPNNLSFYYGLEISPILRFLLRYGVILPLGMAGFFLTVPVAWERHRLLLLYGISIFAGLIMAPLYARYRLIVVPVLILYAAGGLVWFFEALRHRNLFRSIGYSGSILALAVVQHFLVPLSLPRILPALSFLHGGVEYLASAKIYASEGAFERAIAELERLKTKAVQLPAHADWMLDQASLKEGACYVMWAEELLNRGMLDEARQPVAEAEKIYSHHLDLSFTNFILGALYFKLKEPGKSRPYLQRFLLLEPEGPNSAIAKKLLSETG